MNTVLALREALRHLGEWDKKNRFYEQLHAFMERLQTCLIETDSIWQTCQDMRPGMFELRMSMMSFALENADLQKILNGDIEFSVPISETYPVLSARVSNYLDLVRTLMPSLNRLFNEPFAPNIPERHAQFFLQSSLDFELCLIASDMILSQQIKKSAEWVEELLRYMKTNFVFYTASIIYLELFEPQDEQLEAYPILNNAQICAGEFGFLGIERAVSIVNNWGKTA